MTTTGHDSEGSDRERAVDAYEKELGTTVANQESVATVRPAENPVEDNDTGIAPEPDPELPAAEKRQALAEKARREENPSG